MTLQGQAPLGAVWRSDGHCTLSVWAPRAKRVTAVFPGSIQTRLALEPDPLGYHAGSAEGVSPGDLYALSLDGGPARPDPASRFQPRGVHGPSAIVDPAFAWSDAGWKGVALTNLVFYEIHVGTFTPAGTFDASRDRLAPLADLGVTAIEIMPVAQFPGERNWGYDGVDLFAVQNSYGGPDGLKRLVDACHAAGLAAILDVVYNHLGPEGNYLPEFGPYFTDRYQTPWGGAVNFDGPGSQEVRRFFLDNARRWIREFHLDGLRLDAVHAIRDESQCPFLLELAQAIHREGELRGFPAHAIAESDANDSRLVRRRSESGEEMDAQWSDDFHHALHALVTGESSGYYQDFGSTADLAAAFAHGYVYVGQPSAFRGKRHGNSTAGLCPERFVVCAQNHDQVGNRMLGERLTALADFERVKLAAAAVLLSPFLPLLFMGEEYGEIAPFLYFVDHGDAALADAVREGRRHEFASFAWRGQPPDPLSEDTFARSKPEATLARSEKHAALRSLHRELLALRRQEPCVAVWPEETASRQAPSRLVTVRRKTQACASLLLLAFDEGLEEVRLPPGPWHLAFDSGDPRWLGPAPARLERLEEDRSLHFQGPRALFWLSRP